MVTENTLQINKNLQKPKISDLHDISNLKLSLSHHTYKGLVKVANFLIGFANNKKNIFPSLPTISRGADLGEGQVIRVLQEGERLGLWTITHRKDFQKATNRFGVLSNLYTLNPLFYDMEWRNSMSDIFTSLKYLPLTVLLITSSIIGYSNTPNLQHGSRSKDGAAYLDYFSYIKKQKAYRAHAREEFAICTLLSQKIEHKSRSSPEVFTVMRERLIMNDKAVLYDNAVFSETVRRAGKELAMSCAGMCSISSFNDMVINVALKRIGSYSKTINNPFGLFVNLCHAVSKELNIPVKYKKAYALASHFAIKLGQDAAVLEDGNTPREPLKRKDEKLSPAAKQYLASTHKVYNLPLEVLQEKNPAISMVGIEFVSPGLVRVQHHTDTEWRETTHEERQLWVKNMSEVRSRMKNAFMQFVPLDPPGMFHGNPNFSAFSLYHVDDDGRLHDPESMVLGCKTCDKKRDVC